MLVVCCPYQKHSNIIVADVKWQPPELDAWEHAFISPHPRSSKARTPHPRMMMANVGRQVTTRRSHGPPWRVTICWLHTWMLYVACCVWLGLGGTLLHVWCRRGACWRLMLWCYVVGLLLHRIVCTGWSIRGLCSWHRVAVFIHPSFFAVIHPAIALGIGEVCCDNGLTRCC